MAVEKISNGADDDGLRQRSTTSPSDSLSKPSVSSNSSSVHLARAAARGTLITLLLRLVSFVGTQLTLRRMDPVALGKANIKLELLLTTILFTSREGFRLALTQQQSTQLPRQDFWNVAWWSAVVGSLISVLAVLWHLHFSSSVVDVDYRVAGLLYCFAAWVELWAEPAVLWSLQQFQITLRASAEGLASLVKTISLVIILPYLVTDWPVTAFGVAQVLYGLVYTLYLLYCTHSQLVLPSASNMLSRSVACSSMLQHVFILTLQGLFKHSLTEADRIVLTTMGNAYNQGIYAMASAYGSLAARLLFQPLEEHGRLWMGKVEVPEQTLTDDQKKDVADVDQSALEDTYTFLVKVVMYIGMLFSCVAVNYTMVLLQLLAGRKWMSDVKTRNEASQALQAFCVYTALLAANGMTEAFAYMQARTGPQVARLTMVHAMVALLFALVLAPPLIQMYGTVGLIMANGFAMFMRCCYSIVVAANYFATSPPSNTEKSPKLFRATLIRLLSRMLPHPWVLLAFVASFVMTQRSNASWRERGMEDTNMLLSGTWFRLTVQHLSVGIACVVGITTLAVPLERDLRRMLQSMRASNSKQHTD